MVTTARKENRFNGLAVSSGKVVAPACLYSAGVKGVMQDRRLETDAEVERELGRFGQALSICTTELDQIAVEAASKIGTTEAEIFVAQKHILNDPSVVGEIDRRVRQQRRTADAVVDEVFREYEEKFRTLDLSYLRERSNDIGELRQRLLDQLNNTRPGFVCRGHARCTRGKDRVIVARELTAEMMGNLRLESVLGIVTERGGTTSHAAIIARSLGVPAVSGVRGVFEMIECGMTVLVDGDDGVVILRPDDDTVRRRMPAEAVVAADACVIASPPGVEVLANASLIEDVHQASALHADGIGLYRTEILFLRADRLLSEEEQYEHYRQVAAIMAGRPVTFRLLDIGGDKELPFLRIEKESNPFLGWRGARFLLGSPEVFGAQVRALLRLSALGEVRILFPMVIDSRQLDDLLAAVGQVMATVEMRRENIRFGVMLEVPSAYLDAEQILRKVDFASIGSNDLIQYLFAVDRSNDLVSYDYNPEHPILWQVLSNLSDVARRAGKPLSICGEMAGRHTIASRLVDTGIVSLSVSPRLVPRVRNELSRHVRQPGRRVA